MKTPFKVLVAGRSKPEISHLVELLKMLPGLTVETRYMSNGHGDPLHGLDAAPPELLVLNLSDQWSEELQTLSSRSPATRPPMIVVGPADNMEVLRKSMHAGACDFLSRPVPEHELADSVRKLQKDRHEATRQGSARFTVLVNAKGGSGASVLACNLAHLLAVSREKRTALIDLDIQFGALALFLDLHPQYHLRDVLEAGNSLDAVALEGFMAKHPSGLHMLGPPADDMMLSSDIPVQNLELLLKLLGSSYEHVVIDLPRQIDPIANQVLERADQLLIVIQQSLGHIRDAVRLLAALIDGLGIGRDKIRIVVNRYDPKHSIKLADIEQTLQHKRLETLPNDFRRVAESVNLGIPLHDYAPKAPITRELNDLAIKLVGATPPRRGLLSRLGL